ncbi:MAG: hypothetical protein KAY65_15770, partial [Planctomycetes bacterium]|nr:hypothetical protein [Planctomycetota bacterium]
MAPVSSVKLKAKKAKLRNLLFQITVRREKGEKMSRRSKVINIALLAVLCFSLFTNILQAAVSPAELQKIEKAMPAKARAAPKRPRKLLVFNLCKGFKHSSIPYLDKALEIMGR